jgi:hypothetical protein
MIGFNIKIIIIISIYIIIIGTNREEPAGFYYAIDVS